MAEKLIEFLEKELKRLETEIQSEMSELLDLPVNRNAEQMTLKTRIKLFREEKEHFESALKKIKSETKKTDGINKKIGSKGSDVTLSKLKENQCPSCYAFIKLGSKFCTSCGKPVVFKKFCSNCGTEIPGNANFCTKCGTPANSPQIEKTQAMKPAKESKSQQDIYTQFKNNFNNKNTQGKPTFPSTNKTGANNEWVDNTKFPGESGSKHEKSKKILTPKGDGSLMGFVDEDGNFIIEPKFGETRNFSEGLASYDYSYDLEDGCGYVDEEGNLVFKNVFSEAGEFSDGVAMVWPHQDYPRGFIDKKGKWIIKPDERFWDGYNSESKFIEGTALVFDSDKELWGWINKKGEYVIDPIYERAGNFSEGLALVKEEGSDYGYIDKSGKYVLKPQFKNARSFHEGLAAFNINDKWGYIDHDGKTVIESRFEEAENFTGGLAIVKENKKYGLIDKNGSWVATPVYSSIKKSTKGLFKVEQNKKFGYIDSKGKEIIAAQYEYISEFCNGLAAVKSNNEHYYIDINDNIAIKPKFDSNYLSDFSDGVAMVEVDGKYGYIDMKGNWIAEPQFAEANAFCKGLGRVELKKDDGYKYGYIRRDGSYLGGRLFDGAGYFYQDRLNVKIDGKWGCIDREGNWIVKPEYEYLSEFFKGFARVTNEDDETGYIDLDGNLVREMVDMWDVEDDEFDRRFEGSFESFKDDDEEDDED